MEDAVRTIELLVHAGLKPEQAIAVATFNGATYLGVADRIWSNLWNGSRHKCITVGTMDGRYESIVDKLPAAPRGRRNGGQGR